MLLTNLRISIASSGLGHVARGIEAWAADLGRALVKRGTRTIVCKAAGEVAAEYERLVPCCTRESPAARRLVERLPRFLSWRVGLGSGYAVEQTTFAWNLIRLLRREAIDILHVQDPLVALYVQRARQLGLVRTRTILAHGTEEPLEFQRRITFLQHLAPWHLEEAKKAGVWKPTWVAIPNFVDIELFQGSGFGVQGSGFSGQKAGREEMRRELEIPQDAVVVLCAAAIKRGHKRVDCVVREFAALSQRLPQLPLYLVVAGGWERETDELIAEGRALLGDRVRFLVRFPRASMPQLYRAADVFTLGSLKEMMPIALLEATASGLPCVVNDHAVMQWMIGPGGATIDMSRSGALTAALEPLVLQPELRGSLSQAARQHCVENFSEAAVVEQILAYYEQVLAFGKQPRRAELVMP